MPKNMTILKSS